MCAPSNIWSMIFVFSFFDSKRWHCEVPTCRVCDRALCGRTLAIGFIWWVRTAQAACVWMTDVLVASYIDLQFQNLEIPGQNAQTRPILEDCY